MQIIIIYFLSRVSHYLVFADLPIFSVDIHPDGSRFATGGQGELKGFKNIFVSSRRVLQLQPVGVSVF